MHLKNAKTKKLIELSHRIATKRKTLSVVCRSLFFLELWNASRVEHLFTVVLKSVGYMFCTHSHCFPSYMLRVKETERLSPSFFSQLYLHCLTTASGFPVGVRMVACCNNSTKFFHRKRRLTLFFCASSVCLCLCIFASFCWHTKKVTPIFG